MGGQHNGVTVAIEPANELPQPLAQLHIDAGGRLVEHDYGRPMHQRLRHQHPPLHAAREHAHVGVGLVSQIETGEDFINPGVVAADAKIARLQTQRLTHREEGVKHQLLRHHAELAAGLTVIGDHVVAHDGELALIDTGEPRQGRNQRGFARAIGPQQAEELALLHLEINSVERLELTVALAHPGDTNGRHTHASFDSRVGSNSVTPYKSARLRKPAGIPTISIV